MTDNFSLHSYAPLKRGNILSSSNDGCWCLIFLIEYGRGWPKKGNWTQWLRPRCFSIIQKCDLTSLSKICRSEFVDWELWGIRLCWLLRKLCFTFYFFRLSFFSFLFFLLSFLISSYCPYDTENISPLTPRNRFRENNLNLNFVLQQISCDRSIEKLVWRVGGSDYVTELGFYLPRFWLLPLVRSPTLKFNWCSSLQKPP